MTGAIIGDIVGSRFEFHNTDKYGFELFTPENDFTDDTICTIAIADAVNTGQPYKQKLLEWCKKFPAPMGGYGGRFAQWLRSGNPQPYNSFGNGSAMRVSPVAWAYDSLEEVRREAERTASVTHDHPEGIKGAVAVAEAIFRLRHGKSLDLLEQTGNLYYAGFMNGRYQAGVFDETCQGTVPVCFKIVRSSNSFEDAIRKAIAWGGDSDTIGAIVGSMAEAAFDIPKEIYHKAFSYLTEDMNNVVATFYGNLNRKCNG